MTKILLATALIMNLTSCDQLKNAQKRVRHFVLSPFQTKETKNIEIEKVDKILEKKAEEKRKIEIEKVAPISKKSKLFNLQRAFNLTPELIFYDLLAAEIPKSAPMVFGDQIDGDLLSVLSQMIVHFQAQNELAVKLLILWMDHTQGNNKIEVEKLFSQVLDFDPEQFISIIQQNYIQKSCSFSILIPRDIAHEEKEKLLKSRLEILKNLGGQKTLDAKEIETITNCIQVITKELGRSLQENRPVKEIENDSEV